MSIATPRWVATSFTENHRSPNEGLLSGIDMNRLLWQKVGSASTGSGRGYPMETIIVGVARACQWLLRIVTTALLPAQPPELGFQQFHDLVPRLSFSLDVEELLTHLDRLVKRRGQFTSNKDICLMPHLRLSDSAGLL